MGRNCASRQLSRDRFISLNKGETKMTEAKIIEKIEHLGYSLPQAVVPLYDYVPVVIHDRLAFVSGQLPRIKGELSFKGKVGKEVSVEEGQEASRICILNALSQLKKELGSLQKIARIVKITGFVNSDPDFSDQSTVIDGASKFLFQVFGEKGRHTRSAIGTNVLPSDSPVEIELIVALE
jgi:enamine deaminase RidA (YjgF/YER057c/UK114 family)